MNQLAPIQSNIYVIRGQTRIILEDAWAQLINE